MLVQLCAGAGVARAEPPRDAPSEELAPDVTERLTRAMRGLLTAKEQPAEQMISAPHRVRDGILPSLAARAAHPGFRLMSRLSDPD